MATRMTTMANKTVWAAEEMAALEVVLAEKDALIKELKADVAERQASFDLRWESDMRAIKKWQEMTGEELKWPDHTDLCVWLMGRIAELDGLVYELQDALNGMRQIAKGRQAKVAELEAQLAEAQAARYDVSWLDDVYVIPPSAGGE